MTVPRRLLAPLLLATAAAGLPSASAVAAPGDRAAALKRQLGDGVRVTEHRETGRVRFVGAPAGKPIARPAGLGASAAPSTVARAFLQQHASAFGTRELRPTATEARPRGRSAVRLQQLHGGLPVLGGEFVVNLDAERNVLSASGEALPEAGLDTTPAAGSAAARDAAVAAVAKEHGVPGVRLDATVPALWIYDAGILGGPGPERPALVWRLEVKGDDGLAIDELVLVDAHLGTVALRIDQIEHAKNRSVCNANNTAAQYPCTAPVRTEGGPPVASPADVNFAYDFSGNTYDFFAGLGRDSLDGQGMPLKSTVRYCDPSSACPYQNAFWDGQQMVYGQGFAAADDVVGHELAHGVTDFSAHLFYYYQSGAINESLSDVFGEFVDLTNSAGTDTAGVRWLLGEDVPGGGAIRNMANPPAFSDPDRMTSGFYTADPNEQDSGGVHQNSGVNNKAAVLMTDGGSFNGRTVSALGIPKVSRIYYEAQTTLLTSASDYADLFNALQQACVNLTGTGGITSADCTEVGDAVAAVEMNVAPPAAPNPEAPVCPSNLVPTDLFTDDIENPSSGKWTAQPGWFYPQNPNPFFDATYATSGTRNMWGDNRNVVGDYAIAMTQSVAIPSGRPAFLRFNHAYGFEDDLGGAGTNGAAYDGGVLEISTNNGVSYTDIGSLLTDNGYTGTLTTTSNNPIEGRAAFVRESHGYRSSRATLTSLAGQNARFRFRIGTDGSVGDYGWFIDDVRIYTCAPPPPPPPPDTDGDGIADGNDGCPSVAAATPDGCPAPTNPPGTTNTQTTGAGSGTTGVLGSAGASPTLAQASLRSCRLSGRGRRARVRCSLSGFAAVTRATVKVAKGRRTVASGSGRPSRAGVLSIRPRRALPRGTYRVTITLRDARGATRRLRARLRVR